MAQFDPKETLKRIWKLPAGLGVSFQEARCLRESRSWLFAGWSDRPRIHQNTRHCLLPNAEGSSKGDFRVDTQVRDTCDHQLSFVIRNKKCLLKEFDEAIPI